MQECSLGRGSRLTGRGKNKSAAILLRRALYCASMWSRWAWMSIYSVIERFSRRMPHMTDSDLAVMNLKKHEIIADRHHSPSPRKRICRKPLRQGFQAVARVKKPAQKAIGCCRTFRFFGDVYADCLQIPQTARRIKDAPGHRPKCLRIASPSMASPRANSASASASAP